VTKIKFEMVLIIYKKKRKRMNTSPTPKKIQAKNVRRSNYGQAEQM
jgi:hypothetical protein